jgi:hypothetical protein
MIHSCKYLFCLCITSALILAGCTVHPQPERQILHIEGANWACNISTSLLMFGSASESEEHPEAYLPATDGDLLYVTVGEEELYYRYRKEVGTQLVVTNDTLRPGLIYMNGSLCQIKIGSDPDMELLKTEIKSTGNGASVSLLIKDPLTADMVSKLVQLQPDLSITGIFFDRMPEPGPLGDLITAFAPHWLASEEALFSEDKFPAFLELLWTGADSAGNVIIPREAESLETLIFSGWDPDAGAKIDLSPLKGLQTLTLAECNMGSLSQITFPSGLRCLNIVACDSLMDVSMLEDMTRLNSLGLAGCSRADWVEAVGHLRHLSRIVFPPQTSQEDFASVIGGMPALKMVELLDCPGIHDLAPLAGMDPLEVLVIQPDTVLPENLESLDQLDLLILPTDLFENSPDRITELREQLPETTIVPGSGLCLGSGWLLLLLPFVVTFRFMIRRR